MKKKNGILQAFFTSETRIDILTYIFTHPGETFYHNQLQKEFGKQTSQLHRELVSLEETGFLNSVKEGNQKKYSVNQEFPFYEELKGIFLKTAGLGDILKEALAPLAGRITAAFIFGSFANGQEDSESDIDLMVIGDVTLSEISPLITLSEEHLSREVNPTVYSPADFKKKREDNNNFIINILNSGKIFLIGNEHVIEDISQ
jgi:predicted nucleotidyltransferase